MSAISGADDDDVQLPDIHSPDYRRALRERGRPHGDHIKPDDDGGPNAPHLDASVVVAEIMTDFREWQRQRDQPAPPKPPEKSDWWKPAAVMVSAIGLILTVAGSAQSLIASNTKLVDKIDAMDARLTIVEKRQVENIPRLDEQIRDNKLQDQRFQNMIDSQADERKARQESEASRHRDQVDMLAMITHLTEKIADLDKTTALLQDRQQRGGRSEIPTPERDAQAQMRGSPH